MVYAGQYPFTCTVWAAERIGNAIHVRRTPWPVNPRHIGMRLNCSPAWATPRGGVVYLLVGGLAALAALGQGGQTEGSRGALESVLAAPFGKVMLGIIALGLVGYATWRTLQALQDTDGMAVNPKVGDPRGLVGQCRDAHAAGFFCGSVDRQLGRIRWLWQRLTGCRWLADAAAIRSLAGRGGRRSFDWRRHCPCH